MCWHNVDERVLLSRSETLRAVRLPPHLHLLTLGAPLFLTGAGEQIKFRTRKHFALLIRLAVEAGGGGAAGRFIGPPWGGPPGPSPARPPGPGRARATGKGGAPRIGA